MKNYKVVTKEESGRLVAKMYAFHELTDEFDITSFHKNPRTRKELQGKPILAGLLGPMYDGMDSEGNAIIRYESSTAYETLSI